MRAVHLKQCVSLMICSLMKSHKMNRYFVGWVWLISVFLFFFINTWIASVNDYWPLIESLCRGNPIRPFSLKGGRYDTECACPVLDRILIYRVLHVKDMSFDKQGASGVPDQQHTTSFYKTTLFCDHSGVLLSRAPLLQNKQVHVLVQGTLYHKW